MISKLPTAKLGNLEPLYFDEKDTLILSCLQGCMGSAWVDNIASPKISQLIIGDFCFLAGDPNHPDILELIHNRPANHSQNPILMIPKTDTLGHIIEQAYEGNVKKCTRYATRKDCNDFNISKLNGFIDSLGDDFYIKAIDEGLYHATLKEKWSHDFCSQFRNYEHFSKHGLGFVILHGDKPVCGASSYTYYNGGIEIEISTLAGYRRKGLATSCAAKLIAECLSHGLYPSWDAANRESLVLAEKLGYIFSHEYTTYIV